MTKSEFLSALRVRLYGLPKDEIDERIDFYAEAIDDRIEEGLSEEDAVGELGSLDDIVFEIIGEVPLGKIIKERVKPKRKMKAWEIVLLAIGSPVWVSLLAAALSVVLSLYASLWSVVLSLWAVFASLAAGALGGALAGVFYVFLGEGLFGALLLGAAFVSAGLAIFAFFGCRLASEWAWVLTKKMVLFTKKCFMGKEEAK